MQWYVYLILISTTAFLGQVGIELVTRPVRAIFHLRCKALAVLLASAKIALPKPRELAISSREIREYDRAVRNVRQAQRIFFSLGTQLLAFSENEPTIRIAMALFGLNLVVAGHELIDLSKLYAKAKIDSEELRNEIEETLGAIRVALAVNRRPSGNDLIQFSHEALYLSGVGFRRNRMSSNRPFVRHSIAR
jgi:hypothetical protein